MIKNSDVHAHIYDMHKFLSLEMLKDRHQHSVSECHKNIQMDKKTALHKYFVTNRHNSNPSARRMGQLDVRISNVKSTARRRSFLYSDPAKWNKLSADLKETVKRNTFILELKKSCSSLDNHPT